VALSVLFVGTVAACGDGDSKAIDFGQDDDTEINSLTAAELQAMCEQALDVMAAQIQTATCTLVGLTAKLSQGGSCEASRDQCLANPEAGASGLGNVSINADESCKKIDEEGLKQLSTCSLTVGEWETCMNDSLALAQDIFGTISCSSTVEDLQSFSPNYKLPKSCEQLQTKCSTLQLGTGSGEESGSQ